MLTKAQRVAGSAVLFTETVCLYQHSAEMCTTIVPEEPDKLSAVKTQICTCLVVFFEDLLARQV